MLDGVHHTFWDSSHLFAKTNTELNTMLYVENVHTIDSILRQAKCHGRLDNLLPSTWQWQCVFKSVFKKSGQLSGRSDAGRSSTCRRTCSPRPSTSGAQTCAIGTDAFLHSTTTSFSSCLCPTGASWPSQPRLTASFQQTAVWTSDSNSKPRLSLASLYQH